MKHHVSIALRIAITTHVAEILREAGPKVMFCKSVTLKSHTVTFAQGKHISEIAKPTKVHPGKLGIYLEVLYDIVHQHCDQHVFSAFSLRITYSRRCPRMYLLITVCHLHWTQENRLKSYWQGLLWVE